MHWSAEFLRTTTRRHAVWNNQPKIMYQYGASNSTGQRFATSVWSRRTVDSSGRDINTVGLAFWWSWGKMTDTGGLQENIAIIRFWVSTAHSTQESTLLWLWWTGPISHTICTYATMGPVRLCLKGCLPPTTNKSSLKRVWIWLKDLASWDSWLSSCVPTGTSMSIWVLSSIT